MYLSYEGDNPGRFLVSLVACVGGALLSLDGATERRDEAEREEKQLVLPPKA